MSTSSRAFSIEDAIALTKFGKLNYLLIVLSGLLLACGFLETSGISVILPIAECELHLSSEHKGLLGSIGYFGSILSSHFWGYLADTRGRRKIIIPTLLVSFMFTVLSTLTKSFWLLTVYRFLNGFCICAPQSIVYAFLGEFHTVSRRSEVIMLASIFNGIFDLITVFNGVLFLREGTASIYIPFLDIKYNAWRIYLLMCSVPSLISAILIIIFIPESPKFKFSQGDEVKTLKILQIMFKFNTGKSAEEFEVKKILKEQEDEKGSPDKGILHSIKTQTFPLFKPPHLRNMITACYIQFGICVAANGFFTFFPEISNTISIWLTNHSTESSTVCRILEDFSNNGTVFAEAVINEAGQTCITKIELNTFGNITTILAMFSIFGLVTSQIVNKVGKLIILTTVMFSVGTSSVLLMFIPMPKLSIYLYFVILLAALAVPVINASTVELFPTHLRAMAISISMMTGRIGSVAGSIFVGMLINNFCNYTWLLPAVLSFSGGILAFTIPNINRRVH